MAGSTVSEGVHVLADVANARSVLLDDAELLAHCAVGAGGC